jgi:hypothetical protein
MEPVTLVIPTRDRLGYLKALLHWAANGQTGIKKIVLFDMESTYPPMVSYLQQLDYFRPVIGEDKVPVKVHYVHNGGARSLFSSPFARSLMKQEIAPNERFLLSDPDVLPEITSRKQILINAMHKVLDLYPRTAKVGCALRIDDLPDHFPQKDKVRGWEDRFWQNPMEDFNQFHGRLYKADVATTFCMVRRYDALSRSADGPSMRLAATFTARHLPWYEDPSNLSSDLIHYYGNAPLRRWGHPGPGVSWSPFEEPNR